MLLSTPRTNIQDLCECDLKLFLIPFKVLILKTLILMLLKGVWRTTFTAIVLQLINIPNINTKDLRVAI